MDALLSNLGTNGLIIVLLVALTQALDWHSTQLILSRGGVELNPVLKALFGWIGQVPTFLLKIVLFAGLAVVFHQYVVVWVIFIVGYAALVVYNYTVAAKLAK